MNKAISRFLSIFSKQPRLGLWAWNLPLGMLVFLILGSVSVSSMAQPYPQSAGGVLQPSDQGEAVLNLQQRLSELGYYSGPMTGYFDPTTEQAVSRFQQENGLTPDGIVGAATGSVLYQGGVSETPAVSSVGQGSLPMNEGGASITELQQQLAQLGYYTGAVTGVFDQQTQSAVMSFQRDRGLSVDGIVGRATQTALYQQPVSQTTTGTAYTPSETPNDGLLQLGDVGAEVSTLQSQLQALGYYDGPISGSFGSQTQGALMAFQQAQGLTADGIAGPRVSSALTSTTPTVATTTQPAAVQPVQSTQSTGQSTVASTSTNPLTTTPQATTTTVTPSVTPSVAQPQATTPSMVQVPPVASPSVLPPPSPQTQPVALQPSGNAGNPPVARSNVESGRFSIMELQRRLQMRGFDLGDMTGVYDSTTQDAVLQAQQAYGLNPADLAE